MNRKDEIEQMMKYLLNEIYKTTEYKRHSENLGELKSASQEVIRKSQILNGYLCELSNLEL